MALSKIRAGQFQNLNSEIVAQIESAGLIQRMSGHTTRYTLSEEYQKLLEESLKIGNKYIVKEVEQLLFVLQGKNLKIGALEAEINSLNRNQLKFLTSKLFNDYILQKDGKGSGTTYRISDKFSDLRGNALVKKAIIHLQKRQEQTNSPKKDNNSPKT